ncbi:hypothetical protein V5F77_02355 [Xanthobacter sp. DSM 24535]|uniref:DUF4376 domain-containing protein n=1 Tax=Roseixanthobacter psychrophilus TaxID=3119917 RepID=UPI00372B15B9
MTKAAIVENGLVTNLIVIDPDSLPDIAGLVQVPADVSPTIGWAWSAEDGFMAPEIPLADLKAAKVSDLSAACAATIVEGFVSSALGAPHTYPSSTTDQINLMGSVTASLLPDPVPDWSTPFWCADHVDGAWVFRPHSAEQIQTVGADGKAHVVACQTQLDGLTRDVVAAITAEAVAAIDWPDLIA